MVANAKLTVTIRFRASADEQEKLVEVAKHYARTPSDVLRLLILEAHKKRPLLNPKKER